jgi:hypothetical protein
LSADFQRRRDRIFGARPAISGENTRIPTRFAQPGRMAFLLLFMTPTAFFDARVRR